MPTRAEAAERRSRALSMRAAGLPYLRIAAQLGLPSAAAAAADVSAALAGRRAEMNGPPDEFTALELERLDAADRRAQAVVTAAAQSSDHGLVLAALDRVTRISEARQRLVRERIRPAPQEASPVDELRARRAARAAARASAAAAAVPPPS